jgi:hypothetical protein
MMNEYSTKSKDEFIGYLKQQIASIIHIEKNVNTKEGVIPWGLDYINYNDNALQLIRILVLFNVEDVRTKQDESARFPFHLLRRFNVTSLEHIHPRNLILDNIKLDTLTKWLDVKTKSLHQLDNKKYDQDIAKLKTLIKDEE